MRRLVGMGTVYERVRQPQPGITLNDLADDQFVGERVVAQLLDMSLSWIRKQRLLKQGPPWQKIGARNVRYPIRGLREWLRREATD